MRNCNHPSIASVLLVLLALTPVEPARAQESTPVESARTILQQMRELESNRDPKCYATAARLEDFMFGTPLTEEARFAKAELQVELVSRLWARASEEAQSRGSEDISATLMATLLERVLSVRRADDGGAEVRQSGRPVVALSRRDVEHYSSIAYSYRAILSTQQQLLISPEPVLPLTRESIELLRWWLDGLALTVLRNADHQAREKNLAEIDVSTFRREWDRLTSVARESLPVPSVAARDEPADFRLTRALVAGKLAAYEAYNQISMPVFLRNLQVYFARFRWPDDPQRSEEIKVLFNESMIAFVGDTLRMASELARAEGEPFIRLRHVDQILQSFVPYRVNDYEDVIFFPRLGTSEQVTLEAYDTDSFRDSGLHWRYLDEAISSQDPALSLEPDPYAAELIVEGVAQFGVLVLRVAGEIARESGAETLAPAHVVRSLESIQSRIDRHSESSALAREAAPVVSSAAPTPRSDLFFTDITAAAGISFEHRMSDWLNRSLRSYLRRGEGVGTLTIPPAFGGAGIAAGDLNDDGFTDLLLLSGIGNKLYVNEGDGTFSDATEKTPLDPRREDNTRPEPRQPVIADFDNDGRQDILLIHVNDDHRIYRNMGDLEFEDMTEVAGLGGKALIAGPATVADIDGDGLLDIYIGYFGNYLNGVLPSLSRRNLNASPNVLLKNLGDFRFKDITAGSGTGHTGWAQAMSHTDLDGDGRQDLIVGNDFGYNAYLLNRGEGKFEDVTEVYGLSKPNFAMNVGIADLNDDERPDIYISNIVTMVKDEKYVLPSESTAMKLNPDKLARMRVVEANDLFMSSPDTRGLPHYELSDAVGRGFNSTGWSWGASFFDFDNDGDDDLYVLNGMNEYMVYAETPYPTEVKDGVEEILLPVSAREPNVFFLNEDARLENASAESGLDYVGNSRSAAYLDLDNDGDLDVVVNNYQGPALVYRNDSERYGNNWITVKLVGDPEVGSNRDAIGARLIVTGPNGLKVWREIRGTEGYLTVQPREQHFGLGSAEIVDLEIRWPNGERQKMERLVGGRQYRVTQGSELQIDGDAAGSNN